jgi:hypothetical protein
MPTAGAVVIGTPARIDMFTRRLPLNPPADWAGHNGSCEVVNTTHAYRYPIACSATSVTVDVDEGNNRFVVRAYASDRSGSVDSAARTIRVRGEMCGQVRCFRSETPAQTGFGAGDAGIGLLVAAGVLAIRDRRRGKESSGKESRAK